MTKSIVVGLLAGIGAFGGAALFVPGLRAADEIRCRVNVEALVQDLAAVDAAKISQILSRGALQSDRDALRSAIEKNSRKAP